MEPTNLLSIIVDKNVVVVCSTTMPFASNFARYHWPQAARAAARPDTHHFPLQSKSVLIFQGHQKASRPSIVPGIDSLQYTSEQKCHKFRLEVAAEMSGRAVRTKREREGRAISREKAIISDERKGKERDISSQSPPFPLLLPFSTDQLSVGYMGKTNPSRRRSKRRKRREEEEEKGGGGGGGGRGEEDSI